MSGLSRVGAAVRRAAARLVPADRRDWVEAVWAEASEVPPGLRRVARFLRVGVYVAILALIPAKNVIEQVLDVPPRGGIDLRLYRLIADSGFGNTWGGEIIFLVVMALYAAAILWLTSQRSRVARPHADRTGSSAHVGLRGNRQRGQPPVTISMG